MAPACGGQADFRITLEASLLPNSVTLRYYPYAFTFLSCVFATNQLVASIYHEVQTLEHAPHSRMSPLDVTWSVLFNPGGLPSDELKSAAITDGGHIGSIR